jgi:uncharacterized coiled-coil protein SlyX
VSAPDWNTYKDLQRKLSARDARIAALEREGLAFMARIAELEGALAITYDGYSVLRALSDVARQRTSGENVADTLDALAKLQKAALASRAGDRGEKK